MGKVQFGEDGAPAQVAQTELEVKVSINPNAFLHKRKPVSDSESSSDSEATLERKRRLAFAVGGDVPRVSSNPKSASSASSQLAVQSTLQLSHPLASSYRIFAVNLNQLPTRLGPDLTIVDRTALDTVDPGYNSTEWRDLQRAALKLLLKYLDPKFEWEIGLWKRIKSSKSSSTHKFTLFAAISKGTHPLDADDSQQSLFRLGESNIRSFVRKFDF